MNRISLLMLAAAALSLGLSAHAQGNRTQPTGAPAVMNSGPFLPPAGTSGGQQAGAAPFQRNHVVFEGQQIPTEWGSVRTTRNAPVQQHYGFNNRGIGAPNSPEAWDHRF